MYAFHGSSVENFYSIVHNGLLNIFNKVGDFCLPPWEVSKGLISHHYWQIRTVCCCCLFVCCLSLKVSAFGEGTYLSTELGVCLNWSPSGSFLHRGSLPQVASCVAMCEVVKHPSVTWVPQSWHASHVILSIVHTIQVSATSRRGTKHSGESPREIFHSQQRWIHPRQTHSSIWNTEASVSSWNCSGTDPPNEDKAWQCRCINL